MDVNSSCTFIFEMLGGGGPGADCPLASPLYVSTYIQLSKNAITSEFSGLQHVYTHYKSTPK